MRHFFSTSLIALILVISATGATPVAHAQSPVIPGSISPSSLSAPAATTGNTSSYFGSTQTNTFGTTPTDSVTGSYNSTAGTYGNAADATALTQQNTLLQSAGLTPTPGRDAAAASTPVGGNLGPSVPPDYSFNGVMGFIASLFAWLLGVAAITLDNAVYYTVVTMGSYVHNLVGVGIAWRVLRDIGNIVLIFGFLAIGITTILDVKWYGGGFKMLPMLLVAAVFLNFSLFLSEAVIDTGNLFATQFYTQINGGQPAGNINYDLTSTRTTGISNKIMDQLGLQTIYGAATDPTSAQAIFKNSALIGFMSIILFLVAAFVFFSLAFILIARFVILLFLIIIAPIGFAGLAIPQLKGTADKWWHTLFEQTITAPVLLLLLYIAILVITDTQFLKFGPTPTWVGIFTGSAAKVTNITGFASMILGFLIAMGLLLAVVIISKKLSAFGAAGATKLAGKLSFGATAFVGRRTVGRVSNLTSRAIRSSRLGATTYGRALANVADKGAKASFDVRGVKVLGGLGALGIDAGKATEGGYRGGVEKAAKARDDYAKTLSENQKAKLDAAEYQKWDAERQDPALFAQLKPLQQQYAAAMAQGQLAQAQQIQNQISALQAQNPQLAAQHDTATQNITQAKQTTQDMQMKYADSLNNWWSRNVPTAGSAARNEAARQVRSRLVVSPQQRLLNQLQAALNPPPAAPANLPPAAPANPPPGHP